MYSRTLFACMFEHYVGESITNTEHSEVHILLFKAFQKYSMKVENIKEPGKHQISDAL